MRKFICQIFSLRTQEEYDLMELQYSTQRAMCETLRASIMESVAREKKLDEERLYLQDILFKNYGVIPSQGNPQANLGNPEPIRMTSPRWSEVKIRMERDDLERVKKENASGNP